MNVPEPLTPPPSDLGIRFLYMVLFGVVVWLLCWTLAVTAIVQLVITPAEWPPESGSDALRGVVGAVCAPGHRISDICHRDHTLSVRGVAGGRLSRPNAASKSGRGRTPQSPGMVSCSA